MTLTLWLSLFAVCLLGAMSPGPSLALVIGNSLRGSRAAGYRTACAHAAGVALYALLTIGGLAALLTRTPSLFTALQLAGAVYLLYLGGRALLGPGGEPSGAESGSSAGPAASGFLVAFLNPKLAVFMLALFSQFLQPQAGLGVQALMVATVGFTDAAWYCLVVTLVSRPRIVAGLREHSALIDRLFGGALVLLGLTVSLRALLV